MGCRFFTFWCIMFLVHQMGVGMFRLMGAVGRTLVIATSMGSLAVLIIVTMSGFVLAYPQVRPAANPAASYHPDFYTAELQ